VTGRQQNGADDNAILLQCIVQLEKELERATKGTGGARGSSSRKTGSNKTGAHDAPGRTW